MKISEVITDKYKLRIPLTVYYDLLADVVEAEEEYENEIEDLQKRLDIAEYDKERLREEVTKWNLKATIKV